MHGDFARVTFDPARRFSRLLQQQGRVSLEADWNELVAILLHHLRTTTTDVIGWHGTPALGSGVPGENGFAIASDEEDSFTVGPGHYYVNGILCENAQTLGYGEQPHLPAQEVGLEVGSLVYLDVWERHVTVIEDPSIREVALEGADTATRAQVVWQVRVAQLGQCPEALTGESDLRTLLGLPEPESLGRLAARVKPAPDVDDPCIVAPESRYRGTENNLYRVEIDTATNDAQPTFKWSRDNGSVTFPVDARAGQGTNWQVTLGHLGRDDRSTLKEGDWVELIGDDLVLVGRPGAMLKVVEVDRMALTARLEGAVPDDPGPHPFLRRWDSPGVVDVPDDPGAWPPLEDGIELRFDPGPGGFRTGDYWLIPARTATGSIEWPRDPDKQPRAQLPRGITHHYAPLACFGGTGEGEWQDLRRAFTPLGRQA